MARPHQASPSVSPMAGTTAASSPLPTLSANGPSKTSPERADQRVLTSRLAEQADTWPQAAVLPAASACPAGGTSNIGLPPPRPCGARAWLLFRVMIDVMIC